MSLLLSCIAALALAFALTISGGRFAWPAIPPLTLAVVLSVIAAFGQRSRGIPGRTKGHFYGSLLMTVGTIGSIVWLIFNLEEAPVGDPIHVSLQWLHVLALLGVMMLINGPLRLRKATFVALVCIFTIAGILVIRANPRPPIDTWYFQQGGANVLGHGGNPYEAAYEIPYTPGEISLFYGPGVVENGLLMSYGYPPLNLLYQLPFFEVLGDIRYSILLGVILSALFLRWLVPPNNRPFAELAVLFMMFEPVTLHVIRQAWTEPIVLAFWAAAMLATRKAIVQSEAGTHGRLQNLAGVALGLLAAIKQYSPLMLVPPLLQTAFLKRPKRQLLIAGTVAAITIVPFLLWQPAEFLRDVVFLQFRQPYRLDALSLLPAIARLRMDPELPAFGLLPAFVVPFLIFLLAKPLPGRMDQIASTTAAGFIVFIFLNKQSFCNYYWLALGLICAACALSQSTSPQPSRGLAGSA